MAVILDALVQLGQLLLVLLLAPLLTGYVRKAKAHLLRRRGPPIVQPYRDLLKLLLTMRAERSVAVLWATHLCDEVPDADRVIVLHRGKVLADTTPTQLMAAQGAPTIEQAFLKMTGTGGVA